LHCTAEIDEGRIERRQQGAINGGSEKEEEEEDVIRSPDYILNRTRPSARCNFRRHAARKTIWISSNFTPSKYHSGTIYTNYYLRGPNRVEWKKNRVAIWVYK
jgi:hypothetical protein